MAAENAIPRKETARAGAGFNEAAANGRGKPDPPTTAAPRPSASMRPRRMAAENADPPGRRRRRAVASMRPRRMAAENAGKTVYAVPPAAPLQ